MSSFNSSLFDLLVAPGKGVFTVFTGKDKRQKVLNKLYQTKDDDSADQAWKKSVTDNYENKNVILLGIPSDNGGGILRGANWGPLAIREQLYEQNKFPNLLDIGDIKVIPHLLHDKYLNDKTIKLCRESLYKADKDYPVSPLSIAEYVSDLINTDDNKKIFSLGGDHSVSYPMVKSWIRKQKRLNKKFAVIHFDAHTDLSLERLGIDFCFGTWARHIIADLNDTKDLIQIGIRSTAQTKEYWEDSVGVTQYWAKEVIDNGAEYIANKIIGNLKQKDITEIYISFDIDALDSEYVSATGTPEKDGIKPHHAAIIIDALAGSFNITGADLVEVAPYINSDEKKQNSIEPQSTLLSAKIIAEKLLFFLR